MSGFRTSEQWSDRTYFNKLLVNLNEKRSLFFFRLFSLLNFKAKFQFNKNNDTDPAFHRHHSLTNKKY